MLLFFLLRSLVWLFLHGTSSSILRLECRYHANFSITRVDKKYNDTALVTFTSISNTTACFLLCIGNLSCDGVNYDSANSECQLIHTNDEVVLEAKLISAINWNFSTTEFNRKNVGIISPTKFFHLKLINLTDIFLPL